MTGSFRSREQPGSTMNSVLNDPAGQSKHRLCSES